MVLKCIALAAVALLAWPAGAANVKVDPNLAPYKAAGGLTGTITIGGSDSVDPAVQLWLTALHAVHPNVAVKSTAQGSESGFLCLLEGTCTVGTMSREMSKAELSAFEGKFGYKPTRVVVAVGALAIFVHASNPLAGIALDQLDAIYSMSRKGGLKEPLTSWGQLGLGGDWAGRRITPYGRDEHSGTRAFFREKVMHKGDFRPNVNAMGDSQSVAESVSLDPTAIGYGAFNDANSLMKTLPVIMPGGLRALPTYDAIMKGDYTLVRFYYLYLNKPTGRPLPPLTLAFLQYALSRKARPRSRRWGCSPSRPTWPAARCSG